MQTFADELKAETETMGDAVAGEERQDDASQTGEDQQQQSAESTGVNDSAPPSTGSESEAGTVPLRALEDEREKRQYERKLREEYQRRVEELEARVNAATQQTKQVDEEPSYDDIFEDPKAVFERHTKSLEKRFGAHSMEVSREMARAQLSDYDDTIKELETLHVPGLEDAIAKSASPAFTAYRMIKQHKSDLAKKANNPETDELKRQLEEAQRELAAFRGESQRPPKSLGQARGAAGGTPQPVKTVDDVLAAAWDNKVLRAR